MMASSSSTTPPPLLRLRPFTPTLVAATLTTTSTRHLYHVRRHYFSSSSSSKTEQRDCWRAEIQRFWEHASGDAELRSLKDGVQTTSLEFDAAVRGVREQRRLVEECQEAHEEASQRHASLLMRRERWTPDEAAAFVDVTSREVSARRALAGARQELHGMEETASRLQYAYMDALRRKYQEEQAWQDRWRLLGTYGTWGLIGLNSVVFLLSQVLLYRREARRLKEIENLIKSDLTARAVTVVTAKQHEEEEDKQFLFEEKNTRQAPGGQQQVGAAIVDRAALNDHAAEEELENENEIDTNNEEQEDVRHTKRGASGNDADHHTWHEKLKAFKDEVENNLHVPSATAGAVASALVCIVLSVVLSNRRG